MAEISQGQAFSQFEPGGIFNKRDTCLFAVVLEGGMNLFQEENITVIVNLKAQNVCAKKTHKMPYAFTPKIMII